MPMFNRLSRDHLLMFFTSLVILASSGDLIIDLSHGASINHLLQETIILLFAIAILTWLFLDRQTKKQEIESLREELSESHQQSSSDSLEIAHSKRQLAEFIRDQFTEWKLTESEREIGQLLLKGCSLKEIAALRGTAEKTIRQQASSIYQKSGVSGRHAFSAWFIEDIL